MFLQELRLYVEQLAQDFSNISDDLARHPQGHLDTFRQNLLEGINYYQDLARQFFAGQRERFLKELKSLQRQVEELSLPPEDDLVPEPPLEMGLGA